MNILMLFAFFIYFCTLALIGFYFYKRTKKTAEYMLGGRSVNYFVTAIATQASDMGSWLFLGLPAAVFLRGLPEVWSAIGLVSCMYLTWHYIAKKIRVETEKYKSSTITNFLSARFGDKRGIISGLSTIASLYFFTYYIAAGLVGLGILFEAAFGTSYIIGLLLSITTALLYTLLGGFLAVAWSDFFQGLFLLVMITLVPLTALITMGIAPIISNAAQNNIPLTFFTSEQSILASLALALGWGLGYFGQPHILTNFMGIDDPKKIEYAKYIAMNWLFIVLIASVSIGLVGIGFVPYAPGQADQLFITMAKQLFPPLLAGFALCGIIAATLSTMDSHILLSGSMVGEHVQNYVFKASAKNIVTLSRVVSIIVALCALWIASAHQSATAVYYLTNYAWSGLGATFGPVMLCTLYIDWISKEGALAGMISGTIVAATWHFIDTSLFPLVPAFFISLSVTLLLSCINKKRSKIINV